LAESSSSFRRYFFSSFLMASIFCLYVSVVVSTAPQDGLILQLLFCFRQWFNV